MVVYSQSLSSRAFQKNSELIRLTELVQQETATAHLWFEEALGGDETIDLKDDVHDRLVAAVGLINDRLIRDDMLGDGNVGQLTEVRDNLLRLRQSIDRFDRLVDTRWRGRDSTGVIGGAEDQAFDDLFREILVISRTISEQVDIFIAADQSKILAINISMLVLLTATSGVRIKSAPASVMGPPNTLIGAQPPLASSQTMLPSASTIAVIACCVFAMVVSFRKFCAREVRPY